MHSNHMTRRRRLARRVGAATEVERPIICRGCAYRYLVHPTITAACAPSLRATATVLSDERHPVRDEVLDAVRTFVCDGTSPLFGTDVTVARRAADELRELVLVGNPEPMASPTGITGGVPRAAAMPSPTVALDQSVS